MDGRLMDISLLRLMRPDGQWSKLSRNVYVARRLLAFFKKYPVLVQIALSDDPDNRVLWDAFYRFFYRSFPVRTDMHMERGKEVERPWWYNEETYDPRWDILFKVYQASKVYHRLIRPYLRFNLSGT